MTKLQEKTYALFYTPANKKIVVVLENSGAKVFRFPPLETEKINLDEESIAAVKNLGSFDWIIFPDVLTVDYFLQILQENEIDLFEMDAARVCAVGEAVADRLRFAELHADVVPTSIAAANVFLALSDYIGRDRLGSLRFFLPKESAAQYEIIEKLIGNGATVIESSIYRAKFSATGEIAKLKTLLKGGAIDEFIFSSPTDLIALKCFFDNDSISAILSEINVSAADKAILQTLKEHDLKANFFRLK